MSAEELKNEERYNKSVWDIVENVEHDVHGILFDARTVSVDQQTEFVDARYRQLLQDIVYQITALPADRHENGLEPSTEQTEMSDGYNELMNVLSSAFGLTRKQIENDMRPYVKRYTAEDIFTVRKLRKANLLN